MANKKKEDKKLTKDQALKKLDVLKKDLLNIRFKRINNQIENPAQYGEIKKRGQDINNYHFWAWVDPEDVAQAFQLAINSSNYNGYEVYTVAAEDGLNEAPTLEIAQKRWGKNLEIRRPDIFKSNQFASILDTTKIREHLGYKPKISLEKLKSKAKAFKT